MDTTLSRRQIRLAGFFTGAVGTALFVMLATVIYTGHSFGIDHLPPKPPIYPKL